MESNVTLKGLLVGALITASVYYFVDSPKHSKFNVKMVEAKSKIEKLETTIKNNNELLKAKGIVANTNQICLNTLTLYEGNNEYPLHFYQSTGNFFAIKKLNGKKFITNLLKSTAKEDKRNKPIFKIYNSSLK